MISFFQEHFNSGFCKGILVPDSICKVSVKSVWHILYSFEIIDIFNIVVSIKHTQLDFQFSLKIWLNTTEKQSYKVFSYKIQKWKISAFIFSS